MSAMHERPASPSPGKWGGTALRAVSAPLRSCTSMVDGNYAGCDEGEDESEVEGDDDLSEAVRCPAWSDAAELIPCEAASSTKCADLAHQGDTDLGSSKNEVVPKVFTRRTFSPNMIDSAGRRVMLQGCCDRCKSDLNGKLLARCSVCGFCQHLYCFSPPLKQHPALEERSDAKRRVSAMVAQSMIAQWKCGGCARNLISRAPSLLVQRQTRTALARGDAKVSSKASKKRLRQAPSPVRDLSSANPRHLVNVPASKLPPRDGNGSPIMNAQPNRSPERNESQLNKQRVAGFDWYKFRSEKAARVLSQPATKDELVYYSRSVALMRKTARFWHNYVQQKKLRSHLSERRQRWASGPQIYDVKHILSEEDRVKLEASRHRRKTEEADAIRLFTDESTTVVYYKPPRRETLVLALDEEAEVDGTSEALTDSAVRDTLMEVLQRIAMAGGDVDVQDDSESCEDGYASSRPSILGLHLAAKIIQQLVRARRKARDRAQRIKQGRSAESIPEVEGARDRADCQVDEEQLALERRRERAYVLLRHLKLCARFVGVLLTKFRQRQTKKALISLLAEPAPRPATPEDTATSDSTKDGEITAAEWRRVAQSRILSFFRKYVGPRIFRRKFVMSRRIQRWWKLTTRRRIWRVLVSSYRVHVRSTACRRIQRLYRGYRMKQKFQVALEKLVLKRLRLFLRQWIMSRLVKKERERVELYNAAMRLSVVPNGLVERPEASVLEILDEVGMTLYSTGDFWSAAFVFEKYAKAKGSVDVADFEFMVPFAYSHHMTWYSSYDASNLMRAHDLYCSALECAAKNRTSSGAPSVLDPDILQDLALVKMHVGDTVGSLRLLAKLIEFFPHEPSLSLWLLLAAMQLQQRGEWEQSVQYLTYVQDIPPAPYLERDMLVLCAIGLQRCKGEASDSSRKEAWRAALRLWSMDKKTREDGGQAVGVTIKSQSAQARLKWEVVTDLAQRALIQGHYLLSIQTYTYTMTRFAEAADSYELGTAWWNLADAYRHLGKLDLYLDAAVRSQECGGTEQQDENLVATWKEHAMRSSRSFQDDLERLSTVEKLQQLQ